MARLSQPVGRGIVVFVFASLVIGDTNAPSERRQPTRSVPILQVLGPDIPFGPPAIPGVDGPVLQTLENVPAQPFALSISETRTTDELIAEQAMEDAARPEPRAPVFRHEFEAPERRNRPQHPDAPAVSQWPPVQEGPAAGSPSIAFGVSGFDGPDVTESGFLPPDSMGDVGPTQYVVALNGRIRSYNKATLTADGVLDVSSNTFFDSVRNSNSTTDPRVRFDRQTGRWFMVYITIAVPNRIVIAFSDTATITGSTTWTFTFFTDTIVNQSTQPCLSDYETLGIDTHALYIGTNEFCGTSLPTLTLFASGEFVVPKANLIAGTGTVTGFVTALEFTPQGVDNYDASPSHGFFVSVDFASFGLLRLSQISNPATSAPSKTTRPITVLSTSFPHSVPHSGGTRNLDALDDRLMNAVARNGRIWTAHAVCVDTSGIAAGNDPTCRNGVRWYELANITSATPNLSQSGTVFDAAAANPRHYWVPSININSEGVVVAGFSSAAADTFAGAAYAHREPGDAAGTMRAPVQHLHGVTSYNTVETGSLNRWGDYSMVSVDPLDEVTFWTVQEYGKAASSWGTNVTRLLDPSAAPTISDIATQATNEDTLIGPIGLTVTDGQTPVGSLTLGAGSSNPSLVPVSNIVFGGSGGSRTLTITPAANASGSATITVTVNDGIQAASDTFALTVNAVNDPPTIASIADQSVAVNGTVPPLPLLLADIDSPEGAVTVAAASGDTGLLPLSGITIGGAGFTRTLALTPAPGATGSTTVTVTVSDGAAVSSDAFTLTVLPPVLPPSGPPSAPLNFLAVLAGTTLQMSWDLPASGQTPTDYILQAALDASFSLIVFDSSLGSAERTMSVPGVPSGVFHLRVRARNSFGTGPPSSVQTIGIPPNAPTNFLASLNGTTLSMTWVAPASGSAPADYLFEAAFNSSFSPVIYTQPTVGPATSLVVPGVPPGITVFLRVRARNGGGVSAPSNTQGIGPGACTAAPSPVTEFTITRLGGFTVRLAWIASAGANAASDYTIQAALDAGFSTIVFNQPLGGPVTTLDAIAPPGNFFVRIVATNPCGSAAPSNMVNLVLP